MQIGKNANALQLRFDPADVRGPATSSEELAKRTLGALTGRKLFDDNQRVLSQGVRTEVGLRSRAPVYTQLSKDLEDLRSRLGDFAIASGGSFLSNGPTSVTSSDRLNLGEGQRIQSTTTTTTTTPAVTTEKTLDPTQKLNTQPFQTAITNGTVKLTFRVNGGAATTKSINVNAATDSLDSVIAKLNNITVGTKKPLNVTFDAASGNLDFKVTSTSGTAFDFTFAGGTSNFLSVVGQDGVSTSSDSTAATAIQNSATSKKYFKLTVNVEGKGSVTLSTLNVSSASLTVDQKVNELVGQINTGVASLGVTAINAGGGKIGFTSSNPNAGANPNLGLTVTQATNGAGSLKLGFTGRTTTAHAVTNLNLQDVTTPGTTTTTTTTVDTTVGGALGTDASLRDLAGQLGLTAVNGQYQLNVNGQTLSFNENQSLDSVLAGITNAGLGLRASYDENSQRITVESTNGGAIAIGDARGNLAEQLGIASTGVAQNNGALGSELEDFVTAVDQVSRYLDASTARGTGLEGDALLRDLKSALNGLFTGSTDGSLQGLADLGITRTADGIQVDRQRLEQLAATRTDELNQFVGSFFNDRVDPLLTAGQNALQDADAVGATEARAASQAVRVRGEIARLQVRQQMLAIETLNYQNFRERLDRQDEELAKSAEQLEKRTASGKPDEVEKSEDTATQLKADTPRDFPPPPILPPAAAGPQPSTGIGSFGNLSRTNSA